uniref:Uncharacterized protein n=1 Tax=Trypanosoma congolense (strain IL3000) TaxID=1068625 RepID=G0V0F2_TRYCI|nr:conserved hypothetical protein [Trypanosoma congolense IL3000]
MSTLLRSLHVDALLVLVEYLSICHSGVLYSCVTGHDGDGVRRESPLCTLILSAITVRCVELSSKHVAFLTTLCSATGINSPLIPLILYYTRQSLRRTQAAQTLLALCSLHLNSTHVSAIGETTSHYSVCSVALGSLFERCMELQPVYEGRDMQLLLCRALILHWKSLQNDILSACLRWCRRGFLTRFGAEKHGCTCANKGTASLLSLVSKMDIPDVSAHTAVCAAASVENQAVALDGINKVYLASLVTKKTATCFDVLLPPDTVREIAALNRYQLAPEGTPIMMPKDRTLTLHQQLPATNRLSGELKLAALETLSRRILEVNQLRDAVGLAESVLFHSPSLCQLLAHRIFQLVFLGEGVVGERVESLVVPTLTALHYLLPHVDMIELLEGIVMYGESLTAVHLDSLSLNNCVVTLYHSLIKCITEHIPAAVVPVVFHRLCRQREMAAFQASSFVLRILLQALEYVELDSFTPDDVENICRFVQQERLKEVLSAAENQGERGEAKRTSSNESRGPPNDVLLCAIEERAKFRVKIADDGKIPFPFLSSGEEKENNRNEETSRPSDLSALLAMFGAKAATLFLPTTVAQYRGVFLSLYVAYRVSVSLAADVEAWTRLALKQGSELRISKRHMDLVELSEAMTDTASEIVLRSRDGLHESGEGPAMLKMYLHKWLNNDRQIPSDVEKMLSAVKSDKNAAAFVAYVAVSQHNEPIMREIREYSSWSSCAAILLREESGSPQGSYRAPLLRGVKQPLHRQPITSRGVEPVATCPEEIGTEVENSSQLRDILEVARCAVEFVEQEWRGLPGSDGTAPGPATEAYMWARADLLLMDLDDSRKLLHYEILLRLCQDEKLTNFLRHLPAHIHSNLFKMVGRMSCWQMGLTMLTLAEGISHSFSLPVDVYRQAMSVCLMNRVPVPEFVRRRLGGSTTR